MKKLLLFIILISVFGCKSDDSTENPTAQTPPEDIPITGTYNMGPSKAQKGPLESGSTVTIQELDSSLEPVGDAYFTSTEGRFGVFGIGSTLTRPNVDVSVLGYYFNENTGSISASHIVLRTYSDISANDSVVVNVLTTLSALRIKYLVIEESKTIAVARTQAESEILSIFNIDSIVSGFDQMDISIDDSKGGILLAISAILQQGNTAGETHTLIADIALDIKEDGILDTQVTIDELSANAQAVDTASIAINVQSYYSKYGLDITVTQYINYIDSDGDGILNLNDDDIPDTFAFLPVNGAELSTLLESNIITISGLADGGTVEVTGTAYKNGLIQTDFLISNGDTLQLKLTSSGNYSTGVSDQFSIGGVSYGYSVTTKADDRQQITVYDSGQLAMTGGFGPAKAQTWCEAEAFNQGLGGSVIPWLSIVSGLKTLVTPDPINPRQVQSISGGLVASRWTKLFVDEDTQPFSDMGIVDDGYWTGSIEGEMSTGNCKQWASSLDGLVTGDPLDYANYNLHDTGNRTSFGADRAIQTTTCNQLKKLLCIAY